MGKIQGIKAISFDADGTLWDFERVLRHSLYHALNELNKIDPRSASLLDVEKMIEIRETVFERHKGKITDLELLRMESFRQTLKEIGRPDEALAAHLNDVYLEHRFEDVELYEDVLPTLNGLGGRFKLGILSNGNGLPEGCGLDGIFQFTVFSQDYGVEKPDPRLFRIALEKANCERGELLHVGDSLESDIRGASNSGIKCVWLNRPRKNNDSGLRADYEITSLFELPEMI